jgi:hypothetical protein
MRAALLGEEKVTAASASLALNQQADQEQGDDHPRIAPVVREPGRILAPNSRGA